MFTRFLVLFRVAKMSFRSLWAFKLRSIFVASAVALGIASLALIVASVDGAQRKAREIVDFFGPDAVLILGGDIMNRAVGQRTLTLSWADAKALSDSLPGAYLVLPMRSRRNLTLKRGNRNTHLPVVVGTTENYADAWNWPLAEGRDITAEDVEHGAKVALIGDPMAKALFDDQSPIGQTVFIGDLPVTVVGLLSYRGVSGGGGTVDDRMVIPLTTLTQRFNLDRNYFRALRVKFYDPERMKAHTANLRSLLRHLHGLEGNDPDDFTILTADEILQFLSMLKGSLVAFLGATAAVAMLVGGFVLANLFYLSVSERTREIGLRMAMGAKKRDIAGQFLIEAVLLTLVGSVAGMGLGVGLGKLLSNLGILEIQLSPKIVVLSISSATAIGLIFGLRPARRAANMDPIQAMKSA